MAGNPAAGRVGEAIRGRFPVFREKVYVNSCSQGALSDAVRAAYEEYRDGWDENCAEWGHGVERSETARAAGRLHGQKDHMLRGKGRPWTRT